MNSIIILVVLTATTCKVHGYSSGAPDFPEVCTSMAPNRRSHGALPQSNTRNVDKFGFAGPVQLDLVFFDRLVQILSSYEIVFANIGQLLFLNHGFDFDFSGLKILPFLPRIEMTDLRVSCFKFIMMLIGTIQVSPLDQ